MSSIFKIAACLFLAINSYAMTSIEEKSVMLYSIVSAIETLSVGAAAIAFWLPIP